MRVISKPDIMAPKCHPPPWGRGGGGVTAMRAPVQIPNPPSGHPAVT